MKAVILAGGKGERLRPLTSHIPKPMVPILNKPLLEYTIEWLKGHGITEIYMTVNYLGEVIKEHFQCGKEFGVCITYIEETSPLGTAGGVKLAEPYLDETFLVISGDALTDFNALEARDFHQHHGQLCTIVTKAVEMPLDYGLIIGDSFSKQIQEIIEKPDWNEVCTNLVNTGIYLFEPDIFRYMKEDRATDFSRDIFPALLKEKQFMYYYETSDYWSDIGSHEQYRMAQFDLLRNKVKLPVQAKQVKTGIWLEEEVVISKDAKLVPPVYIGKNSFIGDRCEIRGYSIIGTNSYLYQGSYVEQSILWRDQTIMENCHITGAIIGRKGIIEKNTIIFDGAVIGDEVHVKKEARIGENVYIWPNKKIPPFSYEMDHVKWEVMRKEHLFSQRGVEGVTNKCFTPEFTTKLALAFGSSIPQHAFILIGHNGHPYAKVLSELMNQTLISIGMQTMCCHEALSTPIFRYACRKEHVSYGVFIQSNRQGQESCIEFYTGKGIPIHTKIEREIEKSLQFLNFRHVQSEHVGFEWKKKSVLNDYFHTLMESFTMPKHSNFHFAILNETSVKEHFSALQKSLPCRFSDITLPVTEEQFSSFIRKNKLDGGFWFEPYGEKVTIFDQFGQKLDESRIEGLLLYLASQSPYQEQIFITPVHDRKKELRAISSSFSLQYDAYFFFISLLYSLFNQKDDLLGIQKMYPTQHMVYEEVSCHWFKRGKIMRKLIEDCGGVVDTFRNGVKIEHDQNSWTVIVPHLEKPLITIFTKASTHQIAKEKTSFYINKIVHYQKS